MTLGMLSNGGLTPNTAAVYNGGFPSLPNGNLTMSEAHPAPIYSLEHSANGTASGPMPVSFLGNGNPIAEMPPASLDWVCFVIRSSLALV